jgi:CRP/FNR family cyclic AMP-dependent transcriptional regulator
VLSGQLRAYQLTHEGRELLLELIEPGGFDGILSMAGRRGHFTEASADCEIASLSIEVLERMILAEPRVGLNLIRLMLRRLESREEHLEALALHDPSQRLARQLLALGQTLGHPSDGDVVIEYRLTHQMLADMLGMRRETVTLHLHQLIELGAVQVETGRFRLRRERLERVIEGS